MSTDQSRIDAALAPIEELLRPTYPSAADEVHGTNAYIEPVHPDDLRAALDAARRAFAAESAKNRSDKCADCGLMRRTHPVECCPNGFQETP